MAHPFQSVRQSKVEHARVARMTRGYATGGGVHSDVAADRKLIKKMLARHEVGEVEGGAMKARQDRPGRARGGRAPKPKKNSVNVNVIVAPQGGSEKEPPMMPPPGITPAGPPPMPPQRPPMMPSPGVGPMAGLPGLPPGGPPPIRSAGGRAYARGGGIKTGPAFEASKRLGSRAEHDREKGKELANLGRGKPVTYKSGGPINAPAKGGLGPKFSGGGCGGTARLEKQERARKKEGVMAERSSAVRLFAPEHPALARTVRGKLEKQRATLAAQIADGYAGDWANYRERVGTIKGIDEAIQLCIETENNLNGE